MGTLQSARRMIGNFIGGTQQPVQGQQLAPTRVIPRQRPHPHKRRHQRSISPFQRHSHFPLAP